MRILMGFTEVAGYYTNLQKGLRALGVDSLFVPLHQSAFGYEDSDSLPRVVRWVQYAARKRAATPRWHFISKLYWISLSQMLQVIFFIWAVTRFDVFIFAWSTFLSFYDLPILKILGKKTICVFHGSDSRPPYIDGTITAPSKGLTLSDCIRLTRAQKKKVNRIERYAHIIVGHPLSTHLHERPMVPFTLIGLPFEPPDTTFASACRHPENSIRILHAPSNPESKGTHRIRESIEKVRSKGHNVEFVEISGRPHSEVVQELAACDFVVDQLYSDTFMAGLATEAASLGKPSIVGGYAGQEISRIFAAEQIPPVHYCHPDKLDDAVEQMVSDCAYRESLGQKARNFVQTEWSPVRVAERYARIIEWGPPKEWMFDPNDIRYLHGYGFSESRLRTQLLALLQEGGEAALCLQDKHELRRAMLQFVYESSDCGGGR